MHILCAYEFFLAVFPQVCLQNGGNNRLLSQQFSSPLLKANPSSDISLPSTAKNAFVYLEENNYPYENHTIITEDGYILLTVRIPYGKKRTPRKKRPPVIFVHGIFCTFYDFINAGPERAIGLQILEEGYDLWLMNTRGNTHSKRHVTLDPVLNASAYWNFSWHEVGYYDVPANMDYISNITGFRDMSIVGHSQGGTVYLAFAASRPEYEKRITFSIQLGPVSYLKNAEQPVVVLLKNNLDVFDEIVRKYNAYEILPRRDLYTQLATGLCHLKSPLLELCSTALQLLGGPSGQTDGSLLSVLVINDPAGGSAKQIKHYIQVAISDNFSLYDYGPEGNKIAYNQRTPPLYNLSSITSPVAIFYGKSDSFIANIDGSRLASEIPNVHHFVLDRDTNHLDVQWGTRAVETVHKPAIKLLNKYNRIRNRL